MLNKILSIATKFAESNSDIIALGLCGSWARGTARPDSDIDIIFLCKDKLRFKNNDWVKSLDFVTIDEELDYFEDKTYGVVWSRHVFLKSNTEIEFIFGNRSWANTEILDEGTVKVVSNGFRIIYDPQQLLGKLVEKIPL